MTEKIKNSFKIEVPELGRVFQGTSKRIIVSEEEDDYFTRNSHSINLRVLQDGALSLADFTGESFLYFYPDQLEHLKQALEIAFSHRDKKP